MVFKRLKRLFLGRGKDKPASAAVTRQSTLPSDVSRMMEAVTFAEAGLTDYAQELVRREKLEPRKILVVEKGTGLTMSIMEYALKLAERLGSSVVLVNVVPVPGAQSQNGPLPLYKQHLIRSQEERVRQAALNYRHRADVIGIEFQHLVKFGDLKAALREVKQEIRRIELVIAGREVKPEKLQAHLTVPVFHLC